MTAQEYQAAGFRVSAQVSQKEIDRAEADVKSAYLAPILGANPVTTAENEAVMQLAFILLCRRSAVATRSGGKDKTSPQLSEPGGPTQSDADNADRLLRKVQATRSGAVQGEPSKLVDDVCGIYYRHVFLAM